MKITNKQIFIKAVDNVTSDYIETELKNLELDVLRWAIVEVKDNLYFVNVSCVE